MKKIKKIIVNRHSIVKLIVLLLAIAVAGTVVYCQKDNMKNPLTAYSVDKLIKDGQAAEKDGRKDEAIKSYEKVLEKDPENSKIRADLSMLYYQNKQLDKSTSSWQEVVDKNPTDSFALNSLANSYRDQGNTDEAIKTYLKAIDTSNLDSVGNLITLYNSASRFDDSVALLNSLIVKYPENKDLKQLLASTYSKSGNSKKANEILSQIK